MKLSELKTGESGVITRVYGHGGFRKRIIEMGFINGQSVEVILNAPLKDPVKYKIMDYEVSLRRAEAELIEIVSEEEAAKWSVEHPDQKGIPANTQERLQQLANIKGKELNIVFIGNPNSGKTSLFNMASGAHERVGNYSGVTVDAKEGYYEYKGYKFHIVDLPGTYSLSTYSPEELYVRKYVIDKKPDVIINVVDASNLERNLYLTTQLIDMDVPMIMALNMYDELQKSGNKLDTEQLGKLLGVPVVPTIGRTGKGVEELFNTIIEIENGKQRNFRHIHINHGALIEENISLLEELIRHNPEPHFNYSARFIAIKLLENDKQIESVVKELANSSEILSQRDKSQKKISKEAGYDCESVMTDSKYGFIQGALKECFQKAKIHRRLLTRRIDSIVTNNIWGFPIFLLLMYLMFYTTFYIGQYPMDWIDTAVGWIGGFINDKMNDGPLKDLLVDGIIGGVGGVIVFLPNILILYAFISWMEDSGYMARAAFIMDKIMHKMGLHGKSFIPMIMGFGCNIPAIMATRTIESPKSRLITTLIIPFMSCAGRMPVYILIAGAFFPKTAGLVLLGMYALGILVAIVAAKIFSHFFREDDLPFVMELPPYRVPTAKSIFRHTWEKGRQYLQKMSGIILVCSMVIWFLGYFPNHDRYETAQQQQEHSFIGYVGKAMEPILKPLGFDWRMGVGIVAGVGAKELVVSTLGVMYADDEPVVAAEVDDTRLQRALIKSVTPAGALAYMVFILLYFPCIATFIAIRNEAGGWKWAILTAVYTIVLAWLMAFATFHLASLFL